MATPVNQLLRSLSLHHLPVSSLKITRSLSQWSDLWQGFQGSNSKTDWTKAVGDAEKVVGYTTSYLNLRFLLSDEMSNIAFHLRSLVGSGHPLLKTAKRILSDGKVAMQTRGLTVLLLSKAAGINNGAATEAETASGLLQSQRLLAEVTEMLHTAFIVHRCIVNIPLKLLPDVSNPPGDSLKDMDFGNKLSILTGDYLFANACTSLASMRNPKVVEIVSAAIGDYSESEFVGQKSIDSPVTPEFRLEDWKAKIEYSSASLLARACQAALVLSGHSEELQKSGLEFGKNLAFAWQGREDIENFQGSKASDIDPLSLPIVAWKEHNRGHSLEFSQLVLEAKKDDAIDRAEEIKNNYISEALRHLDKFPVSAAKKALENIVSSLR